MDELLALLLVLLNDLVLDLLVVALLDLLRPELRQTLSIDRGPCTAAVTASVHSCSWRPVLRPYNN